LTRADVHNLQPLLDGALTGDAQAWNALLAQLRPYLHAIVRRTLGAEGGHDHSNIVQSSLRRIWEHREDLNKGGLTLARFLGWVERIAHNRSIDALRRPAAGGPPPDDLPEPRRRADAQARDGRAARLLAALARLPERQRQVVELFWFDGLSDEQIRERLGGSVGALRVLRLRALRKLRELMGESHDDLG
jgi:RNA polymerase sigma-70 factor (ECF subfamily)